MAVVMALAVFAGFAPTYYLRAYFGRATVTGGTSLTPLAHLHGALFTSWVDFLDEFPPFDDHRKTNS
jgi:hypothetical protein